MNSFPDYAVVALSPDADGLSVRSDPDAPSDQKWFLIGLTVDGVFAPFARAQFEPGRLGGMSLPGVSSEHIGTTSEESIRLPANHIQIFT